MNKNGFLLVAGLALALRAVASAQDKPAPSQKLKSDDLVDVTF